LKFIDEKSECKRESSGLILWNVNQGVIAIFSAMQYSADRPLAAPYTIYTLFLRDRHHVADMLDLSTRRLYSFHPERHRSQQSEGRVNVSSSVSKEVIASRSRTNCARPKSSIFTLPSFVMAMFEGFISR
jgi:hypothetical protein